MVVVAPERSLQQRMDALGRANEIRSGRAQLKKDVKAGLVDPRVVLREVPVMVETMRVFDLLLATPKIGRVKANRILMRERISPSKTISGLSERQRLALLVIGARGWRL